MKTKPQHTPTPWEMFKDDCFHIQSIEPSAPICLIETGYVSETEQEDNAEFIIQAVNSHEVLLKFAKKHHEVCEDCEGTGKIYKHADPTTGQWVPCPIAELLGLDGAVRGGD